MTDQEVDRGFAGKRANDALGDRPMVIIESPFHAPTPGQVDTHIHYCREAMRECLKSYGEAPLASHLLYTQPFVLDDNLEDERALGINAGLSWRKAADYAVFYVDFGWSPGMIEAMKLYWHEYREYRIRCLKGIVPSMPAMSDITAESHRTEKNLALLERVFLAQHI